MSKQRLKEIIEVPWILVSTGFWMMLATYRGLKLGYLERSNRQVGVDVIDDNRKSREQ